MTVKRNTRGLELSPAKSNSFWTINKCCSAIKHIYIESKQKVPDELSMLLSQLSLSLLQPRTKKLESFPTVRVYDMWNLWFAGKPDEGLPPFRHLKGNDFEWVQA
ncbi:hypothetical protein AC1031_000027 [Aphanomyces cochlioides]|nr:hypothetical protein AC1031_000027 [Aphanomyces cochlioides]